MSKSIFYLFIFSFFNIVAQDTTLLYTCSDLNRHQVRLEVTHRDSVIEYLQSPIYILKYELKISDKLYSIFYTYKYKNRLYISDKSATIINCTKDQILLDRIPREICKVNVGGIFENLELKFDNELTVNDKFFYFYSTEEENFSELYVNKLVFNKQREIAQVNIKSYDSSCLCSRKDFIIRLSEQANKTKTSVKKQTSLHSKKTKHR